MSAMRTRWAAIGAAVAVTLGGGGFFVANAGTTTPNADDAAYHPVTPVRVLDTRRADAVSNGVIKLDVEGPIATINSDGTTTSVQVAPTTASAVAINLTVTEGQKNGGYGFVKVYPCTQTTDAAPEASAINFENKVDIANALNVTTSATGEICFSVYGTADLIVDMSGYYDDSRLDDIEADYLDNDASITMTYPGNQFVQHFATTVTNAYPWGKFVGGGSAGIGLSYPSSLGAPLSRYRLSSFSICWPNNASSNGAFITDVQLFTNEAIDLYNFPSTVVGDFDFTTSGCKTYEIPTASREGGTAYYVKVSISDSNAGTAPELYISHVNATYSPYGVLLNFPLIPILPLED